MSPFGTSFRALLGAAGRVSGHKISQSLRFNDDDTAYLHKTFADAGTNEKIWCVSVWYKRANISSSQMMFSASNDGLIFYFHADDTMECYDWSGSYIFQLITTQKFRDSGAWGHLFLKFDSAAATSSDRVQLWHNGVRITDFSTATYPSLNQESVAFNNAVKHWIGASWIAGPATPFDGYMADFAFIDGTGYNATDFGEFDSNGVWRPKNISGLNYTGNHSFRLDFANSLDFGQDASSKNNDFTAVNFASTDQMKDSPTDDAANNVGNYATLNSVDEDRVGTLSDGNLVISGGSEHQIGTIGMLTGKWTWKVTVNSTESQSHGVENEAETETLYTASFTSGDVIQFRFDADAGTLDRKLNAGAWTSVATGLTSGSYFPLVKGDCTVDFGQAGFTGADAGAGFKLLNTANLPAPAIKDPSKYFQAKTYTGNGSTQSITGINFQPDFVWMKNRSNVADHALYDSSRTLMLSSNSTAAEVAASNIIIYNSDGWFLGTGDSRINADANTYVGWTWKESATPGFDIVTYTGIGANINVTHSLGVAPSLIITKNRDNAADWAVYYSSIGTGKHLKLNTTAAQTTDANIYTAITSTTWSHSSAGGVQVNADGDNYVAYAFAEVPGFSRFGSYTGNGSTNGPFAWCGFKPAFVLLKPATDTGGGMNWAVLDSHRSPTNPVEVGAVLIPNTAGVEITAGAPSDFLSNGFKVRGVAANYNASGATYIFAAFAEHPFGGAGVTQARAR